MKIKNEVSKKTSLQAQELGMNVKCIDNFDYEDTSDTFVDERNGVMLQEIHQLNKDVIFRIGSAHLYGLLTGDKTISQRGFQKEGAINSSHYVHQHQSKCRL